MHYSVNGENGEQVTWDGDLLAETETSQPLRWAIFRLYSLDSGGYLAWRVGRSRIYHDIDNPCQTQRRGPSGQPVKAKDLPWDDDPEPCERCRPPLPGELGDDDQVRFEVDRHTFDECDSAEQVRAKLTRYREWDSTAGRSREVQKMSSPVFDLLEKAARANLDFAELQLQRPVRKIGA